MKPSAWCIRLAFIVCFLSATCLSAFADVCGVCSNPILTRTYLYTDKVLNEKVYVCHDCSNIEDECFACGLPVKPGSLRVSDGRFFCARDEQTAMLNIEEGQALADAVKDNLDRLFARFTTFPTNLNVTIMDRVDLLKFKVPGNDYTCPNILGLHYSRTNRGRAVHEIKILSGLTRSALKSTCAHEYAHAWAKDNIPAERKKLLGRDAEEGFCELVAYLLMEAQQEDAQKKEILANTYTRGQIDYFVQAENKFGFNDVLEWMRYGVTKELSDNLNLLRDLKIPESRQPGSPSLPVYTSSPTSFPDTLVLKGISWSKQQPWAVINDQSFTPGETAKVGLGKTNVTIRCLEITSDSVRIQIPATGEERNLKLPSAP